jgi:thiamine-phosphate pyrophosphorylase
MTINLNTAYEIPYRSDESDTPESDAYESDSHELDSHEPVSKSDRRTLFRILDANLDRAREGLRTIEEWCRFGLNDETTTAQIKHLRQAIARWHTPEIRLARDTPGDLGTGLSHPQESTRSSITAVLQANFARSQEALRVLEEYGKLHSPEMAAACKQMRYEVYALDSQVAGPLLKDTRLPAAPTAAFQQRYQQLLAARTYLVSAPVPGVIGADWLGIVEAALKGGIAIVQYREKTADDEARLQTARQLRSLCHQYGALFIVNDRVDIAVAADADGVHLGQHDLPMDIARKILGPDKIIGRSTTNPAELARANAEKADYIGVGPVHETPTKPGKAASGDEYVRYAAQHATMPWFTIGGLNADNLGPTLAAGATRVAVVRALMQADNPTEVARSLVQQTQF